MNIEPGRYEMTNADYHAGPGISKSHLDKIAPESGGSPRKYWHHYLNPDREPAQPTADMILGTAIHSIVLEPDLFTQSYVANPGIDRRSKAGKVEYAHFEDENPGKIILEDDDYQTCLLVRDAVFAHPVASGLLTGGKAEDSFFAIDQETGELVKCRTDYFHESAGMIVDLKSTNDASEDGFGKHAGNLRYHIQPPWYQDVFQNLYGEYPPYWVFLAVEKKPPFEIGIYYVEPDQVERARRIARRDFLRILECKQSGHWPGFCTTEAKPLKLPGWLKW